MKLSRAEGLRLFEVEVILRLIAGEFSFAFSRACIYIQRFFRVLVFNCVFSAFQLRRILVAQQAKLRPVAIKINSPLN